MEEIIVAVIFAALYLPLGVPCLIWAWRMRHDRIPMNHTLGMKTEYAYSSEENWYASQRAAAPGVAATGIVCILGGVASIGTIFFPYSLMGVLALTCLGLTVAIAYTYVSYFQMKRRRHEDDNT
ncbi:SdpI family protein [Arcanobacterium haemolyticum]|nr:SdpI family protein [Arcanobacterium haemolyticum]